MTAYHLERLFPPELSDRLEENPTLVLPFGTIEWHSYHLPLGLDGLVAEDIGRAIADELDAVLAPVSYWAAGGVPYPYTLKLPRQMIEDLLTTLFAQFAEMGFQVIVGFAGHFGLDQTLALKRAALHTMRHAPVTVLPVVEYDLTTDIGYKGDHAGVGETSLLWALDKSLVRLDVVPIDTPLDGVLGSDPRGEASREKGEDLRAAISSRAADMARRLLHKTSPVERAKYIDALEMGVRVLAKTAQQREVLPKTSVPSTGSPAYLEHLQAMYAGDYEVAKSAAARKLADLTA